MHGGAGGPPGYEEGEGEEGERYRRGVDDGVLVESGTGRMGEMGDEEVRRINEERRLRMRRGGFTNWVLRRKGKGEGKGVLA